MTASRNGLESGAPTDPFAREQPTYLPFIHHPPAVDAIVALLAQGLELIFSRVCDGKRIVRQDQDVPTQMQLAQARIGRLYLEEGKVEGASADLHGLIALCRLPFSAPEWGLDVFARHDWGYRDTVLVDPELRVPTPECAVIAASYNGFGENQIVEKILFDTLHSISSQFQDKDRAYTTLREILGRHSLISENKLVGLLQVHEMLHIQSDVVRNFYEAVPQAWLVEGKACCCSHCGTLMKPRRTNSPAKCTMVQCATIENPGEPILLDTRSDRYLIAKPQVLKYWTEPAIDELKIYDAARQAGIESVALYPFCDAVDITLLDGMEVGIDAKSYASPEVLAMKFINSGIGRLAQYNTKIIAINDACEKGAPHYRTRLIDRLMTEGDKNPARGVRFMTVSEVIEHLPTYKKGSR